METAKSFIHMNNLKGQIVTQLTLDDDFNVQNALSVMYDLVTKVNSHLPKDQVDKKTLEEFTILLKQWLLIFGVAFEDKASDDDQKIAEMVSQRDQARKDKDWATSDKLRDELKALGIVLEDTPQGTRWHRA